LTSNSVALHGITCSISASPKEPRDNLQFSI
jgi:hypothetical protein